MPRLYSTHADGNVLGLCALVSRCANCNALPPWDRFPSSVWLNGGHEELTIKVRLCALRATLTASPSPRAGRHTDDGKLW